MNRTTGSDRVHDSYSDNDDPFADADYLPDLDRASNPWKQLWRDLNAPAPVSTWASRVTVTRVRCYDQIRIPVTRGMLLGLLVVLMTLAPDSSWITWALLTPAFFQVVSEISIDLALRRTESRRSGVVGKMAAITDTAHSVKLVNVTGVVGTAAVPANLIAVAYFTGPGEPSWVKVLALTAAIAYGVSAILSLLTDTTNYDPSQANSDPYRIYRRLRPHLWLIACVLTVIIVAGSVVLGRWAPVMQPLAWAQCALPVLIGSRQRDYERFLRASSEEVPNVQRDAKSILCKDYHNANTSIRTFTRQIAGDDAVPAGIRAKAAALAPIISLMPEAIDRQRWVLQKMQPSLAGIAAKCASDAHIEAEIDLKLDAIQASVRDDIDGGGENYELARTLIGALLNNAGQALKNARRAGQATGSKRVVLTGEVQDGEVRLTVRDPLPLIADWCHEGSTTLWLHRELLKRGGTGLSQHLIDDENPSAGKEIRARWPAKRPPLRLTDLRP